MRSPESDPLFPTGEQYCFRYQAVKLSHPITGVAYGIRGICTGENGRPAGYLFIPDISCDYFLVSRLAANCTVKQLDLDQLMNLLSKLSF